MSVAYHRGVRVLGWLVLAALPLAGCEDGAPVVQDGRDPLAAAIVSDPTPAPASGATAGGARFHLQAADDVAYVSLPPQSLPDGERATIRNPRTGAEVETPIVDGGFDPVPVAAGAGDTLEIDVQLPGGATLQFMVVVPPNRRPIVVRTDPPPRKRDVPLNAAMVVVFSEPIDPATVTASTILLLQNGQPVAGRLEFRDAAQLTVGLVPGTLLLANTEYELAVAQDIGDLDGETLPGPVVLTFTTAAVPSVTVVPRDTTVLEQDTVRLVATLRDADGTEVTGRPVSWVLSDTAVISIVDTGPGPTNRLIRGRGVGSATVTATIDGVSGTATITVLPAAVASVTIRPALVTLQLGTAGDTGTVIADRRNANGSLVFGRPVTWAIDNPVATIQPFGDGLARLTAVAAGSATATVTATSEGVSGTASVTVSPPPALRGDAGLPSRRGERSK